MTLTVRILLLGFTALTPGLALAQALPSGGSFAAGSGNIASAGTATTVTQSTARGVINWQSFSIASGHSVQFENGSGATLNRVTGAQMSELQGHLGATGSLYLINPNGVVIGPNGSVATGGRFVASTRDASDSAFMQGKSLTLSGSSSGTVKNEGRITSTNGNVVLVGQSVSNSGTVSASNGTVALAAGNKVILSEAEGPDGIYVETDADAKGDVTNTGHIQAAAARLAAAGGNVYALAGNRDGLIQATGTSSVNGQVFLTAPHGIVTVEDTTVTASTQDGAGGTIRANGREVSLGSRSVLDASATQSGKQGGQVLVGTDAMGGVNLATRTTIASGATLKARGKDNGAGGDIETSAHTMELGNATIDAGVGGQWLLDPLDLTIDAGAANTISDSLNRGTSVTEMTTATNAIIVNGDGTASSGNGDIILNAPISWSTASTLTLSAYRSITLNAGITVTGSGKLALVTNNNSGGTSSGGVLALNGSAIQFTSSAVTAASTASNSPLTINGNNYTLIASTDDLKNVGASGYYALARPIDATGVTGFAPRGGTNGFTGDFNGLGNTISNLTISSGDSYVGLFGSLAPNGTIENIGMIGGSVSATQPDTFVGGLVGWNNSGTISNAYATGNVLGSAIVGGLVGWNNSGTISNAYATGSVSSSVDGSAVGGLVGYSSGTISNAYAIGSVSGNTVGGFVGRNDGTISNVYWDTETTRQTTGVGMGDGSGATGLTTAGLQKSLPSGFDSAVWGNAGNQTTPYLLGLSGNQVFSVNDTGGNLYTVVLNTSQLQVIQNNLAGRYVLGNTIDASGYTGFAPIGTTDSTPFTGTLDGLGYTINNLVISSGAQLVGLIGFLGSGGSVQNIGMIGGSTTATADNSLVGGLVGGNGGTISNAYATGSVTGSNYVGGLVGVNGGTISNAYATGSVSGTSGLVGGLVGLNYRGTISNAYAIGGVSGTGDNSSVGGLVGGNDNGTISNAYATGSVSGSNYVGGLVGGNDGTISNAYATGSVSGTGTVGGLVGWNDNGTISNAYWDKDTTGQTSGVGKGDGSGVSGLTTKELQQVLPSGFDSAVWGNAGNQTTPYLLGLSGNQVFSVNDTGGNLYTVVLNTSQLQAMQNNLAGRYVLGNTINASGYTGFALIGTTYSSSFTGTLDGLGYTINNLVISSDAQYVGLIGYLGSGGSVRNIGMTGGSVTGTASNSYAGGSYAGGLVGWNEGAISNAYATGNVSGDIAGGLVGWNEGAISNAYATGSVSGRRGAGGLVGGNDGAITNVYATGSVSGGSSYVGGLAGGNYGAITNAYATGSVSGSSIFVGGLVGLNARTITNVYATGSVSGSSYVGGLVGGNLGGTSSNAYWDTDTTGQTSGSGVGSNLGANGLTTSQWLTQGSQISDIFNTSSNAPAWIAGSPYPILSALPYIVIKASNATQVYGSSVITASDVTYTDQKGAEASGRIASAVTWQNDSLLPKSNVGSTGVAYGTGASASGYQIVYASTITNTITPATLTLTADPASRLYGSANPSFSGTVTGFVNGESQSSATTGTLAFATDADTKSNVGSYGVTVSGLAANNGNYTFVQAAGNATALSITPAALTITAGNQSGTYGQTPALGSTAFTTSGLATDDDSVTGVTLATDANAESPAGSYALSVSNAVGSGLGNYTITYQPALYTVAEPEIVVPELVTPAPVTPEPVTPEVVTPVVITPAPETLTPEVVTTILTPTTPEAVIVVPTPTATAVALSRVYWPTPVTAPANGSFAGSATGSGVGFASGSTVQKSDASGNTAQSDSSNAGLASDLTAENGAGLAYRITLPTTSILNQLRKAQ